MRSSSASPAPSLAAAFGVPADLGSDLGLADLDLRVDFAIGLNVRVGCS